MLRVYVILSMLAILNISCKKDESSPTQNSQLPSIVVLSSPANASVNQVITPTLVWIISASATTYRLQVATDSAFTNLVFNDGTLTLTTKQLTGLSNSTVYFWRVNATNSSGTSSYSNIWSFTTIAGSPAAIQMIQVSGGTFSMGDITISTPVHQVTLSNFYISKTEVTQWQYQSIMGNNPSNFASVGSNGPVEKVNWYNCISFCNKLSISEGKTPCYSISGNTAPADWTAGTIDCNFTASGYRLPTEAEWEYAAKGGSSSQGFAYSGSNSVDGVAWSSENSNLTTHLVSTKLANELGLFDMSGNVWEWCWDLYAAYSSSAQTDPTGAYSGTDRIIRGGSWYNSGSYCRVSYRGYILPGDVHHDYGFRIVKR